MNALLFLFILLISSPLFANETELAQRIAQAQDPQVKGLAIAQMVEHCDSGWQDSQAHMNMLLRNKQGDESIRELRVSSREVEGDGDKSLSIFDAPADVKGSALLTWSHALKPDDQWIYLPALKRVKRIASKNKSGPFMGSEFAYEDIGSQEVDKYTYRYLRDETYNDMACYVIARFPAYEYSGYTRQVAWVDQQHFNTQKIMFYDRKDKLLKTLTYEDYRQYLDQYWRAHKMLMDNHQTGKSTLLTWKEFEFGNGFTDRDFDRNTLKRLR